MRAAIRQRVHSGALLAATVLLGISWSVALIHLHTGAYPLIWAAAMPALAVYYITGGPRSGAARHLPAAAMSIYALLLWRVTSSYGALGHTATIAAVLVSMIALAAGARITAPARTIARSAPARAPRRRGNRRRLSVQR